MKIANLEFEHYAALAPMAGAADITYREICRRYGASFTVSELISAKAVSLGDKKSMSMLEVSDGERPCATQLFGCDPAIMAQAAKIAERYHPEFIDINMGCPAPKVAASGGGAVLMKDELLAARIVSAVVDAVSVPVTVKMRAGWDEDSINAPSLARLCEKAGAAAITVHGRTRDRMYAPPVNYDVIAEVKRSVGVPVIGNGDISTPRDAAQMYEKTNCDLVMVGRAALGAPWIFERINAYIGQNIVLPEPPLSRRMEVLLHQAQDTVRRKGEKIALKEMRKHAAWYMRGVRGAANFRRRCGEIETMHDLEKLCFEVCREEYENEV